MRKILYRSAEDGILLLANRGESAIEERPEVLGAEMLKSNKWIIKGAEPFRQAQALYELIKYLRGENKDIDITIFSKEYSYDLLRCASLTDEILDMSNILVDKNNIKYNLKSMEVINE